MKKLLLLLALLFACAGDAGELFDLPDGGASLGVVKQAQFTGNYRSNRLLGTTPSNNQKCTPTQAASTECYYVRADPATDFRKSYKIYLDQASFGVGTGADMAAALQSAANLFNNTSFKNADNSPIAAIVISNTNVGAQGIVERIQLPFSTSTNLINHMLVQHDSSTLIADKNCTNNPCVDMPGVWKRGALCRIRITGDNLYSIPGVPFAKAQLQAMMAGIMGCIGMGRQSTVNTSWTFNFIQPTVYNLTDAWGTNNCEDRYAFKHQAPDGNENLSTLTFHATSGTCSL